MNKISKFSYNFALLLFAITAVTNVSFGTNTQKETNAEQILKNELGELNKEKENQKTSWFNKLYLHKIYGDEPHYLRDFVTSLFLSIGATILLNYLIPESKNQQNNNKQTLLMVVSNAGFQFGLGSIAHQHKIRTKVRNEKIKNLEEILEKMKKDQGKI